MERTLDASDDQNTDYVAAFNRYGDFKNLTFENAIELGCGLFTNLRLIAWVCKMKQCTLLDLLAEEYLNHPRVFYNKEYLYKDGRFQLAAMWRTFTTQDILCEFQKTYWMISCSVIFNRSLEPL